MARCPAAGSRGRRRADRLRARPSVAFQGADRGVPRPGQQHRGVGAVLGLMSEGTVAQLVQRPPGRLLEQVGGTPVGQAGAAADQVQIPGRDRAGRRPVGQEHRAARPAGDQAASSRAVPVCQWIHSTAPPLEVTRARLLARSRSSRLRLSASLARAAVSYTAATTSYPAAAGRRDATGSPARPDSGPGFGRGAPGAGQGCW